MPASMRGRRIGLLTSYPSRLGGGVFEAVVAQAAILREAGAVACVIGLRDEHSEDDRHRLDGAECLFVDGAGPRQIGYAPDLLAHLLKLNLDCLHLHGIWMYPSAAAWRWSVRTRRPHVVSPHGMLDPWITRRGRWKKAAARLVYERRNWKRAAVLHALTDAEAADIARESGRGGAVVIPNAAAPARSRGSREVPDHRIVYIGRIHPKKNLEALVSGWKIADLPPGARLSIAGWGEDADVAALQAALVDAPPTIEFLGPVFGNRKEELLRSARFVILPSHSEGLPMAMVEAWALGIPTIMTSSCNLPSGFLHGAALETGHSPTAIAAALHHALRLGSGDWLAMSKAAGILASSTFSPEAVGAQWIETYRAAMEQAGHDGRI